MADTPGTLSDTVKLLAKDYIKSVVKTISEGMGGKSSDAVGLSNDEELEAWMRATASPEQIAQMLAEGADDEAVLKESRKYRYALGKAAGKNNPELEAKYHEKMAAKAQAWIAERMPKPEPTPVPDISGMVQPPAPQPAPTPQQPVQPMMLGG